MLLFLWVGAWIDSMGGTWPSKFLRASDGKLVRFDAEVGKWVCHYHIQWWFLRMMVSTIITIDDYTYVGICNRGDLDMPLLPNTAFNNIGMHFLLFNFFLYIFILKWTQEITKNKYSFLWTIFKRNFWMYRGWTNDIGRLPQTQMLR